LFGENTRHTILVPANSTGITVQVKMQVRPDICYRGGITINVPLKSRIATCDHELLSNGVCSFDQLTWVDEIIPGANNTNTVDVAVACPTAYAGPVYDISLRMQTLNPTVISTNTATIDDVMVCNFSPSAYSDIRLNYTHDAGLDYLSRS